MIECLIFVAYWTGLLTYLGLGVGLLLWHLTHLPKDCANDSSWLYGILPLLCFAYLVLTPFWPLVVGCAIVLAVLAGLIYFIKKALPNFTPTTAQVTK